MSTSGISLVLALTPHRFPGLNSIGLAIFLVDLVCFLVITTALFLRFFLHDRTFRRSLTRPGEALFVPTFWLSIAAILSNIGEYGRLFLGAGALESLAHFLVVAFWMYLATTFAVSVFQYHILFNVKEMRRLKIASMTPAWILPIFPVMLAGTLAGGFTKLQPPHRAIPMVCAGLAAQGLGLLVSVFMYSTYLSRLMAYGLPAQRPGMFIAVGPPSFTCAALLAMASDAPRLFASDALRGVSYLSEMGVEPASLGSSIRALAVCVSIFLLGLSFWFFCSAVTAVAVGMPDRRFHLSWWSFVFPNAGFTIACIRIGRVLESPGILWTSTVMTVLLVAAWAFIVIRCGLAVYKREIVWPGHDEDSGP
jgi:tellurite resistance protein TehA-like permease